jgi:hypothetical protein
MFALQSPHQYLSAAVPPRAGESNEGGLVHCGSTAGNADQTDVQ